MLRKEKIIMACHQLSIPLTRDGIEKNNVGFNTETMAAFIGISRNNVSAELNSLVEQGILVKLQGRPVRFLFREMVEKYLQHPLEKDLEILPFEMLMQVPTKNATLSNSNDPFENIIGAQGSLKKIILQMKAAAIYPPRGLHTILAGETGVGKSMLAERMYIFSHLKGVLSADGKFITYNCAEHANNPQLISSYLFGYKKGAFTDAKEDTPGVLELADGGVLFLDEIHRLSHEAQELLFIFIDKGTFHRIGEPQITRTAKVFLIGATTEALSSFLLKTFTRRMPNVVFIPNLESRGFVERIQFIKFFFTQEALSIQKQIMVDASVMKLLALYPCAGNVGQLKADLQLVCAKAYLDLDGEDSSHIQIDMSSLPEEIYQPALHIQDIESMFSNLEADLCEKQYSFPLALSTANDPDECKFAEEAYKKILSEFFEYYDWGCDLPQMQSVLAKSYRRYFLGLVDKCMKEKHPIRKNIQLSVSDFANTVASTFCFQFSPIAITALTEHISSNYEYLKRSKATKFQMSVEDGTDSRLLKMFSESIGFSLPDSEILLLRAAREYRLDSSKSATVSVVVAAFGQTTASSIGSVVNQLLGNTFCNTQEFDLSQSTESLFETVKSILLSYNNGVGFVVFVDMVSLKTFFEVAALQLGIPIYCIVNLSVTTIVDISKKCIKSGYSIEEIRKKYEHFTYANATNLSDRNCICVTCTSGKGASLQIIKYIQKFLPAHLNGQLHFLSTADIETENILKRDDILAIIGTKNLHALHIPFIHTNEFIYGNGLQTLLNIVQGSGEISADLYSGKTENILMQIIRDSSAFIDPQKAWYLLDHIFDKLICFLDDKTLDNLRVRFILHGVPMLERCIKKEPLCNGNTKIYLLKYHDKYDYLKKLLQEIEETFACTIPDSEITYILEMICENEGDCI